jgi:hypothetical protein
MIQAASNTYCDAAIPADFPEFFLDHLTLASWRAKIPAALHSSKQHNLRII